MVTLSFVVMVFRDDLLAARARNDSLEREVVALRLQLAAGRRRGPGGARTLASARRSRPPRWALALIWVVGGVALAAPFALACVQLTAGNAGLALGWCVGPLLLSAAVGCGAVS